MNARDGAGHRPAHLQFLRHRPWLSAAGVACIGVALCWTTTAVAQGKDDLWDVTTKMEMPGMPMAMPAQTHRICIAKGGKDDDYVPKRENCRMLESKRVGSKVTYRMACTGKDAMTISGETTYGATSYEGRMVMTGATQGQSFDMTQTYSGKRVGDCTAAK